MAEESTMSQPKKKTHFGKKQNQNSPDDAFQTRQYQFSDQNSPLQPMAFSTVKGEFSFEFTNLIKNQIQKQLYSLIEVISLNGVVQYHKKAFLIDDRLDLVCLLRFPTLNYFRMDLSNKKQTITYNNNEKQTVKLLVFEESEKSNTTLIPLQQMNPKLLESPEVIFCVVYELEKKLKFLNLNNSDFLLENIYYTNPLSSPDSPKSYYPGNFHFSLAKFIVQNKADSILLKKNISSQQMVSKVLSALVYQMINPPNKSPQQMPKEQKIEDPQVKQLLDACMAPYSQDAYNKFEIIVCSKFCRNQIKMIDLNRINALIEGS